MIVDPGTPQGRAGLSEEDYLIIIVVDGGKFAKMQTVDILHRNANVKLLNDFSFEAHSRLV